MLWLKLSPRGALLLLTQLYPAKPCARAFIVIVRVCLTYSSFSILTGCRCFADSIGPGHFAEAKTKRRCATSLFDRMGYWDLQSHGALHVTKISEEEPVPEKLVVD